ncbi:MAG: hypothetical protein ABSA93_02710 [Streptosporangiaceae bacterium]|jgi:5-methyltetrahydropteroyltriglutamate--homocysteine methyltransferase
MAYSYKFHADHVGTLLRPPGLEDDEAIAAAIRMQREAGLDLFTDGGFRRRDFWSVYADAFSGFTPRAGEYVVSARVEQQRRMTEGEAEFLRSVTARGHLKVTLPAPGYVAERCWRPGGYESPAELGLELAGSVRAEIEALFAGGVIYVQLDNPGYTGFLNSGTPDEAFERMLAADTVAVAGVARPDGASIGLHVCRGSSSSDWLGRDGESLIAARLLGSLPVDRFLLEYDDWRTGSLAPLRSATSRTARWWCWAWSARTLPNSRTSMKSWPGWTRPPASSTSTTYP